VRDAVREDGFAKPRIEGEENGEWIIVDCGQAVVHIMQPMIRQYYNLEELWGSKPIDLKDILAVDPDEEQVPAAKPIRRKKAGVAVAADAPEATAAEPKKAAAKKTDTKKAEPKKPKVKASGDDAPVEKKAPARKRTTVKATVSTDGGAAGQAKPKKVKTLVVGAPVASKAAANRKPAAAKSSSRKA
jgi:ribosome-associated protein